MKATIFLSALALTASLYASGFEKDVKYRGFDVHLLSEKPLTVGNNDFVFSIKKGDVPVDAKEVKVKFFMPAMPSMPYMEAKADAKPEGDGKYDATVNISMRGTWQVHIFVTDKDDKKYRIKTSVNF